MFVGSTSAVQFCEQVILAWVAAVNAVLVHGRCRISAFCSAQVCVKSVVESNGADGVCFAFKMFQLNNLTLFSVL